MCDCNVEMVSLGVADHTPYSALRHHLNTAEDIRRGEGTRAGAGNLLCAIRGQEVLIETLPIPLHVIEQVAGRKINDPII